MVSQKLSDMHNSSSVYYKNKKYGEHAEGVAIDPPTL